MSGIECVEERRPCEADPDLFFPPGTRGEANERQVRQAKALCRQCPERTECLQGALARREQWGVWGGEFFEGRSRPGVRAA